MENKIVLASTKKGYADVYFWSALSCIALGILSVWCSGHIDSIYALLKVSSFSEFKNIDYWTYTKYDESVMFCQMGIFLSYAVIAILAFVSFYFSVYSAKRVNTLYKDEQGFLKGLSCNTYDFPFSRSLNEPEFDRIIHVAVNQGSIGRIFNTGTISLKLVTFTNADSKEQWWDIPAIEDPYTVKEQIDAARLKHEGLTVKMTTDESK